MKITIQKKKKDLDFSGSHYIFDNILVFFGPNIDHGMAWTVGPLKNIYNHKFVTAFPILLNTRQNMSHIYSQCLGLIRTTVYDSIQPSSPRPVR